MGEFFKLGGAATSFFDPTQPIEENKFLGPGQAKELEVTPKVSESKLHKGLIEITEKEAKSMMTKLEQKNMEGTKAGEKALDAAAKKELEASETLKEAKEKVEAAKQVQKDLDAANEENVALKARLEALESGADGGKGGKKN
jgi:rubrerythrin